MIKSPGQGPSPGSDLDLVDQMAAEAGVTRGALFGRPEVTEGSGVDLLAMARELAPAAPEWTQLRPEVLDALMGLSFGEVVSPDWRNSVNVNARKLVEQLDLRANELEAFWNQHILDYADERKLNLANLGVLGKGMSGLIGEVLGPEQDMTLVIPDNFKNLSYLGHYLQKGHLVLVGDLGDHIGEMMGGSARLTVRGRVGDKFGSQSGGSVHISLEGDCGDWAGSSLRGQAEMMIKGSAGSRCASTLEGDAQVTVHGNVGQQCGAGSRGNSVVRVIGAAGRQLGCDAQGSAKFFVFGSADDLAGQRAKDSARFEISGRVGRFLGADAHGYSRIEVDGDADDYVGSGASEWVQIVVDGDVKSTGVVKADFAGTISSNGQPLQPEKKPRP